MTSDRFWSKVMICPYGGCWEWVGTTHRSGYGLFYTGKTERAHRYSFRLLNGPIPEGAHILHKCDRKSCVNPDHLYAGTRSDNMRDAFNRGRRPDARFLPDDVRAIRRRLAAGERNADVARSYGVHRNVISDIRTGKTWRWIGT